MSTIFKLGIIGFGNMGKAIALGALNSGVIKPNELAVCDLDMAKLSELPDEVFTTSDVRDLNKCEYVLFAVKPQGFATVAKQYSGDATVVSIMAGVKVGTIMSLTGASSVCRIMPNTPCLVEKGMCALSFVNCTEDSKAFLTELFSAIGDVVTVDEEMLDAVTAVSGSGPAYVYYFVRAMAESGAKLGLSEDISLRLALQTFEGAVEMVRTTQKPLDELIKNVCSPGGTTIQAINHFDEAGLGDVISKGMEKCAKRSAELSLENK